MQKWIPDDEFDDQMNGAQPQVRSSPKIRFKFTRFRDIALETAPPYLIHEMLPRIGVVVVWGKPKCGKTFWVLDLEMHVALGWDYRGRLIEGGSALHIACEGGNGVGARKEAWRLCKIEGKTEDGIAEIENAAFFLCRNTALDLIRDVDAVIADIATQFPSEPIRLITIDTLNRSLKGSEAKDEDMGRYLSAAIALADKFQCSVLVIHHCGHTEDRPRGHSSLLGGCDALIEVQKDAKGLVSSEVEEMRDGPNGAKTFSRLQVINVGYDDNLNPITSCVIIEDEAAEEAQKKSRNRPPSPMAQKFHAALCDALCTTNAQRRPQSGGRISVTQEQWKMELIRLGLIDGGKSDAKRSLVSKYRAELIAADWAACNGEFIWSINDRS